MGIMRSLIAGLFQAIAIIPGILRSDMTITGGFIIRIAAYFSVTSVADLHFAHHGG